MMRRAVSVFVVLWLMVVAPCTLAEDTQWRQGENSKVLPQYCQDRLDKTGRWTRWKDYFGPAYIHMHHYCGGIYAEFKAQMTMDKKKRANWVREIIVQMNYVSPYCDPSCPVYADLHRRWAWALAEQGRHDEAAKHMQLMAAARKGGGLEPSATSGSK